MLRNALLIAAVLAVTAVFELSVRAGDRGRDVEPRHIVDARMLEAINGTYVERGRSGGCDVRVVSSEVDQDAPRAITVVYTRGLMALRAVPPQSLRLVHVQTRPQFTDTRPVRFHNGLGRWEDGDLVVDSLAPALPLWSRQGPPRDTTLHERFSFVDGRLTYHVSYRWAGYHESEPFEVTLTKCEAPDAN